MSTTPSFGYAIGAAYRRCPTVDGYETIALMKLQGHWDRFDVHGQAQAVAYLETPIGRLLCALRDARTASWDEGDKETAYALDGLHTRAMLRLLAIRATS